MAIPKHGLTPFAAVAVAIGLALSSCQAETADDLPTAVQDETLRELGGLRDHYDYHYDIPTTREAASELLTDIDETIIALKTAPADLQLPKLVTAIVTWLPPKGSGDVGSDRLYVIFLGYGAAAPASVEIEFHSQDKEAEAVLLAVPAKWTMAPDDPVIGLKSTAYCEPAIWIDYRNVDAPASTGVNQAIVPEAFRGGRMRVRLPGEGPEEWAWVIRLPFLEVSDRFRGPPAGS